ncbi:hypothetical protein EU546_02445 [Candidatus Thorarchaeota archaeon]|nr:MAG: hypothetical protein EU546_02445 [Candidatus Thorarchaeota archaeon]
MIGFRRGIASILLATVLVSMIAPSIFMGLDGARIVMIDDSALSDTDLAVTNRTLNIDGEFNDDDFEFRVLNFSSPVDLANVSLYFVGNGSLYESFLTDGLGYAVFKDVAQGTYTWEVTWDDAPDVTESGIIISDGPEAFVELELGNLDADNDDDDLYGTVTDIDGDPAEGLNFTLLFAENASLYYQTLLGSEGIVNVTDIPEENYTWQLIVEELEYAGTVLDEANFTADGTTIKVHQLIGPFSGDPEFYDLEVYVYYETTQVPFSGALVNVTYKNGTEIASETTPSNGTVVFLDLPVAFVNWTVTFGGEFLGAGNYFKNLTTSDTDVRAPVVVSPGDQEFLVDSDNITVSWYLEDQYPSGIELYLDGELEDDMDWVNSSYEYIYNVTGFDLGHYELRLVATDENENSVEDTITLRIYENVTPTISGPEDIEFFFTETGYSLRWNISEENPSSYVIWRNGTEVESGDIDPLQPYVEIDVEDLAIGLHVYTITVNDTSGNEAADEVLVTVLPDMVSPQITFNPETVYYAQGDLNVVRNWTATDDYRDYYTIEVDGFIVEEEDWTSERIEFDFAGLAQGEHWVVLTVYDIGGNSASAAVQVVVTPPTMLTIASVFGGIIGLAVVIYFAIWYLRRR